MASQSVLPTTDSQGTQTCSYSAAEELANSLSHGVGAILSVVGLILLIVYSSPMNDPWKVISFSIYGTSLVSLYLASTLYHSAKCPKRRAKYMTFDHCAIYLLIAGSYTPFLLVNMRESVGWPMFAAVWGIAIAGIILKIAFGHRFHNLRLATYLVMGWLVVLAGTDLVESLAAGGLTLLIIGGLTYTLGVIFYVGERIPFNHAIWHLFVLGGSICHYFAVYYYVLPAA
ncbi:PAQR family membrane homeostasis protein TrhA [Alkalimarinus alittae]|uniref:Hemolysin III family protein n=1 Tax=Alkalimarinus alittae TaxID=2961619 RepID=A0ABY6N2S0_9ALTE|nr:hemolysin III family protein [Alkalimarinus alittae]UZE96413.1 hemolysin III family protein [Alkalimarinus alittae]